MDFASFDYSSEGNLSAASNIFISKNQVSRKRPFPAFPADTDPHAMYKPVNKTPIPNLRHPVSIPAHALLLYA